MNNIATWQIENMQEKQKRSPSTAQVQRILQINTHDRRGGAERVAWNLLQAYAARGHASWLVVGKKYSRDPHVWEIRNAPYTPTPWARRWLQVGEALSPLRRRGVKGIGALQQRLRLLTQPAAWRQRRQGYEEFAYPGTQALLTLPPTMPDLIHCHNLHGDYFDLAALPWLSRQRPVILHLHDSWLLSGHCAHARDCTRWQIGCGACPYLDTYPAITRDNSAANWQHKRAIYANSQLYVATVSQWLMDKVERSMLPSVKKRVIYNGIDLTRFQPQAQSAARQALHLPVEARIVLLIAHSAFKDEETMVAALQQITCAPTEQLLFICLAKQGAEKRVGQGRMIYPGWIASAETMTLYYSAADVYIHAAFDEAFGQTITEAGACGTPVVATAVGGIPEQIVDGVTGFLVPPQAPQAMAGAIQTLLDDAALRRQMGQSAAAHVRQHFGLAQQVEQFLAWYEEVYEDWQQHQKQ